LLAFLFVRPGTLARAEWDEIHFEAALWKIPAPKMKKRREFWVPLAAEPLALFRKLHTLNGWSRFVFPSRISAMKPISKDTFRMALVRLGYRGKQSAHGFRAVARTTISEERSLGNHNFSKEAVRIQMSHKHRDKLDEIYDCAERLAERRRLMEWWAEFLIALTPR
jgi:integrase